MNILEFKRKNYTQQSKIITPIAPAGISAIGIDLGTTHSVVSIFRSGDQKPTTLFYNDNYLIDSILYYDDKTDKIYIGAQVKEFLHNNYENIVRSTKRNMGVKGVEFCSNKNIFSAEQVATAILNYIVEHPVLREEKEKFGGIWAVLTVPAHFDDAARTATISAANAAGINVLRIINEPTAAALAYSKINSTEQNSSEYLAVFDFGGGTFDVSIVERNGNIFNVLSSEGDLYLGGDDIDDIVSVFLLKHVQPVFVGRRADKNSALYKKIVGLAREAKIRLKSAVAVEIIDNNLDGKDSSISLTLTRDVFDELITPLIEKTIALTEQAMHFSKKDPRQISKILLVGGSTRLNLIRSMLNTYFPCEVDASLEPDLAVSWGASLQAAIILGCEINTILVDVCSHSLGIGVVENTEDAEEAIKILAEKYGLTYPICDEDLADNLGENLAEFNFKMQGLLKVAHILYRNTPLPACKSEFFHTVYDDQEAIRIVIVQGEEDMVFKNKLIGTFLFPLELPAPANSRCEIQLSYDVNGMIQVFAKQLGTNNEAYANFDSNLGIVKSWERLKSSEIGRSIQKITNSLIGFVNQELAKLAGDDETCLEIYQMVEQYSKLLEQSQNGENNDALIEGIEDKLLSRLDIKK